MVGEYGHVQQPTRGVIKGSSGHDGHSDPDAESCYGDCVHDRRFLWTRPRIEHAYEVDLLNVRSVARPNVPGSRSRGTSNVVRGMRRPRGEEWQERNCGLES